MCLSVLRCSTSHQNLKFLDCLPYPGQSCAFKCNPGFRSTVDTTISCLPDGHWAPSIDTVCEGTFFCIGETTNTANKFFQMVWTIMTDLFLVILCPPLITNGRLAPDCSRQIGTSCSFTCDDSYKASILPRSITYSSDAVLNKDVDELCIRESIWFIHYAMHKINSLLIFVQFIFLILIWNSYIYFFKFLFLQ